jgi:RNA recognition motif-containing protein
MAVGPSCPDLDVADVGLSMMSPAVAVGPSCPDQDFSPTMMPPSWPDLDFTLAETMYALPLTSLDDFLAPRTSVLLRGLPPCFTRSKMMEMLDGQGLALSVDFSYVPGNLKLGQNCGYAFVNFTSHEAATACLEQLEGFNDWGVVCEVLGQGESVCEASWCSDRQGLHTHVEHYRNSRIMHASVDDEYKPAVFTNGSRAFFPPPSKVIRAPRLRKA